MNLQNLTEEAAKYGVTVTSVQLDQFKILLDELLSANALFNLTAVRNPEEIIEKHFLDSLTVAQAIPAGTKSCIDIGTGAGFPGLPLKIIFPEIEMVLVDASAKKISFIDHCIQKLGLQNIEAIHTRAEELAHNPKYREHFDCVFGRAVAELSILAEYTLPFIKIGGRLIAQKSENNEGVESATNALQILGGKFEKTIPVALPTSLPRQLLIIEKVAATPSEYPRRTGVPTKRPL
jgi:16S rRNA (guanine527-N7)-methyltransferase